MNKKYVVIITLKWSSVVSASDATNYSFHSTKMYQKISEQGGIVQYSAILPIEKGLGSQDPRIPIQQGIPLDTIG